ncbi:MAG: alpha-D-ribose 1-methylphosphonate 5-triphosphate diphosphatase [Bryobacterales bacterium]|jgi:alpha-D-ribose 1-methylphosphonate 5-triphosphate diphosphatase|nr:alpha-D-ribose 1-methylphosphonate 5-triphosphate diphosphatase [Bryobacterales bacterium]
MPRDLLVTNATVVSRHAMFRGSVSVNQGKIVSVDEGQVTLPAAQDWDGDYLIAGLVELHTDHLETHLSPRPNVHWRPSAALSAHDSQIASAGITTVLDAICLGVYEERQEFLGISVQAIHDARQGGMLRADHYLHLRCEVVHEQVTHFFQAFADDPILRLVSLMDHTPGQRQWKNLDRYRAYYGWRYKMDRDGLEAMIAERMARQQDCAYANTQAIVAACRLRAIPLASHDDTEPGHAREAASLGVTISEFPTTSEAALAAREEGMGIIMGSPNLVLGGSHSGNVSALALARERLLDALASDYVPVSLLEGAMRLHFDAGYPLPDALATVTCNPARMVGLHDRGEIVPGARADLVRVRMAGGAPWVREVWREGIRVC